MYDFVFPLAYVLVMELVDVCSLSGFVLQLNGCPQVSD